MHARRPQPALEVGAKRRALGAVPSLGDAHLGGVGQVQGQVGGRGVAARGFGFQAAQDDFLQPRGQVGPVLARRGGGHPQALAQSARGGGGAKRQLARGQLVQHHANGEDVAARVAAHAHHLLGRHPRGRAHGLALLFGQQVGEVRVARQAKVQQHGMVLVREQHVAGLEVEVAGVLLVQAVHRVGQGGAQAGDEFFVGPLARVQPVLQGVALQVFHGDVGQPVQVARGHKARHVWPGEGGQDLQLHLKAHDVLGPVARGHARDLHGHGKARVGRAAGVFHPVDMGHAPCVDAVAHHKAVHHGAGFQQFHRPTSRRWAKLAGKAPPVARMAAAASATA